MMLDWLSEYNLVLLNANPNCTGETTWSRGDHRSSIDFMLVNQKLNRIFHLIIDEEKHLFDLSDHHMIEAEFTMPFRRRKIQTTELVIYFKISEATTDEYKKRLEERLKPAVHLHTPNRLTAEFNMGAYEYALTRRVSVAIATHVKFSD